MTYEENGEGEHEGCGCKCHKPKEFKLAIIEKKEKILKAELEFIGQMKDLIKKMPDSKE